MGRKKKINHDFKLRGDEIIAKFEDYLKHCKDFVVEAPSPRGTAVRYNKPRVPHILEFCMYANMSYDLFTKFRSKIWYNEMKDKFPEDEFSQAEEYHAQIKSVHEACERIYDWIYAMKTSALVNGEGNTNGLIFDFRVNHNLDDKAPPQLLEGKQIEVTVIKKLTGGSDNQSTD